MRVRSRTFVSGSLLVVLAIGAASPLARCLLCDAPPDRDWNARAIAHIAPVQPGQTLTFAVLSDSRDGQETFRQLLTDMAAQKPRFVMHLGDFVTHGSACEYAGFLDALRECPMPMLTVVGNHEICGEGRKRYEDIFGWGHYSFSVGQCLFVVVDDADKMEVDRAQMKWLNMELGRRFRHKFVFMHVPPFDPRLSEGATEAGQGRRGDAMDSAESARRFMRAVERHGVDIVFASHIHGYFDALRHGVRYAITGGAGAPLDGSDPDRYFHHYLLVTVDGANVSIEVRRASPASSQDAVGNVRRVSGELAVALRNQIATGRTN